MDRCRLKGIEGDRLNATLSVTGMNFGKLLKVAARLPAFLRPVFAHLFEVLEQVLWMLQFEIFIPDQPDQIYAFA